VSGTYNGVHVESIQFNDVDVNIEYDPRRYSQVLTFTFRIKRDDVTIALGTPVTGAVLGDLSDVDVTGVTNGQLIAYNSTTGNWEAANDAGGANELSDLSDASVSLPSDGEVLIYSGGEFVNDNIAISNVTGLQAALDAAPDNLRELTDVTISGLADNDYLQYNSATGVWENSSLIVGRNGEQYTGNYDSEAETLLDGATETVELYYTAQADGDGLHEDAQTDTAQSGYDIRRKLYYAEKAQADPNTSGDWTQFTAIADNTTFANAKTALLAYLKERTGGTVPISLKMTWEEVAQAPAFTGLLNESYGSGAEAAYSTRRLNGNVTECMVIRRASDSTTTTIGFDGSGNIDESAIETFCTGTTCTVVTWKDQSGNGNDATAPSTGEEPTIYTGGALVKENGKVALDFDGSNSNFDNSTVTLTSNDTLISVISKVNTASTSVNIFDSSESNKFFLQINSSTNFVFQNDTSNINLNHDNDGIRYLSSLDFNGSTLKSYFNGQNTQTATVSNQSRAGLRIGKHRVSATGWIDGTMQELIYWNQNKNASLTSIESNIGDYFTQNTPLLDTYSGAAAAYSLRLLDSTYTGALINVWNGTSYADIYPNVFGELDTVALAAHCGSNDGFIRYWYDQSSNGNTAAQTTTANMPKIYDGTTGVVTENGKPAVDVDGVNDSLVAGSVSLNSYCSWFYVAKPDATGSFIFEHSANSDPNNGGYNHLGINNTAEIYRSPLAATQNATAGAGYAGTSQTLINWNYSGSWTAYKDGATLAINAGQGNSGDVGNSSATDELNLFSRNESSLFFNGKFQEIIFYNTDQDNAGNRTNIEDNINTFYNIYS
jgi:hypothetical protein